MRATVIHGPGDVRLDERPDPQLRRKTGLLADVLAGTIDPGAVFDLELPLEQVAQGYAAMDDRRAIKVLLRP